MILAEYPRSGGTWTSYLLSYCLNVPMLDLDSSTPKPSDPLKRELVLGKWQHRKFSEVTRIAKTHKLPQHIETLPLEKKILLVRDGRDCMVSYYFFKKNQKYKVASIRDILKFPKTLLNHDNQDFTNFIHRYGTEWKEYIIAHLEDSDYILKYEDLNQNTTLALKKLFHYFELDVSEEIINYAVDLFSFKNMTGGREKGKEESKNFVRKGTVGDWKEKFKEQHQSVWNNTGANEVLKKLGYIE
jgi:hypothetical protein